MPSPKIKIRKKPTNKRCQDGYPCKTTCISRLKNCRNPLNGQATTLTLWLKHQEEMLEITNKKRARVGLSPATITKYGYITAERNFTGKKQVEAATPIESKAAITEPSIDPETYAQQNSKYFKAYEKIKQGLIKSGDWNKSVYDEQKGRMTYPGSSLAQAVTERFHNGDRLLTESDVTNRKKFNGTGLTLSFARQVGKIADDYHPLLQKMIGENAKQESPISGLALAEKFKGMKGNGGIALAIASGRPDKLYEMVAGGFASAQDARKVYEYAKKQGGVVDSEMMEQYLLKAEKAIASPVESKAAIAKGKYREGETIKGLGKITEVFDHGDRGFQYKIGNEYFHERVLDGAKNEEFKEKWITPSRLNLISKTSDFTKYPDQKLQDAKRAIEEFTKYIANSEVYTKNDVLTNGVNAVNAEMKFLVDKGFYRQTESRGFAPKYPFLQTNLNHTKELIDKEVQKRTSQTRQAIAPPVPTTEENIVSLGKKGKDGFSTAIVSIGDGYGNGQKQQQKGYLIGDYFISNGLKSKAYYQVQHLPSGMSLANGERLKALTGKADLASAKQIAKKLFDANLTFARKEDTEAFKQSLSDALDVMYDRKPATPNDRADRALEPLKELAKLRIDPESNANDSPYPVTDSIEQILTSSVLPPGVKRKDGILLLDRKYGDLDLEVKKKEILRKNGKSPLLTDTDWIKSGTARTLSLAKLNIKDREKATGVTLDLSKDVVVIKSGQAYSIFVRNKQAKPVRQTDFVSQVTVGTDKVAFPKSLDNYTYLNNTFDPSKGYGLAADDGVPLTRPDGTEYRFSDRQSAEQFGRNVTKSIRDELAKLRIDPEVAAPSSETKPVAEVQSKSKNSGNGSESAIAGQQSSARLSTLEASLEKKKAVLDSKFENHFKDVARANGQPLNDKRNGQQTLDRWDKQSDSIRMQKEKIAKTEAAIERERTKIANVESAKGNLPKHILDAVENGELTQWRKHPNFFFVPGVDKARIVFDKGVIKHRYLSEVTDKEQYKKFAQTYNKLKNMEKEGENPSL